EPVSGFPRSFDTATRARLAHEYRAVLYRQLVRQHTTLDVPPAEIHRIGLAEVARIQAEMEGVKREMGFTGPLPAFFDHIR
ncbi:DUF885 family protein, partial [Acinetobacter baumannii]